MEALKGFLPLAARRLPLLRGTGSEQSSASLPELADERRLRKLSTDELRPRLLPRLSPLKAARPLAWERPQLPGGASPAPRRVRRWFFSSASFCFRSLAFTKAVGSKRGGRTPVGDGDWRGRRVWLPPGLSLDVERGRFPSQAPPRPRELERSPEVERRSSRARAAALLRLGAA